MSHYDPLLEQLYDGPDAYALRLQEGGFDGIDTFLSKEQALGVLAAVNAAVLGAVTLKLRQHNIDNGTFDHETAGRFISDVIKIIPSVIGVGAGLTRFPSANRSDSQAASVS